MRSNIFYDEKKKKRNFRKLNVKKRLCCMAGSASPFFYDLTGQTNIFGSFEVSMLMVCITLRAEARIASMAFGKKFICS